LWFTARRIEGKDENYSFGDTLYRIYDAIIRFSGNVKVLVIACSTGRSEFDNPVNCVQACPQHYVLIKTTNNHIADCQSIIRNI